MMTAAQLVAYREALKARWAGRMLPLGWHLEVKTHIALPYSNIILFARCGEHEAFELLTPEEMPDEQLDEIVRRLIHRVVDYLLEEGGWGVSVEHRGLK